MPQVDDCAHALARQHRQLGFGRLAAAVKVIDN